MDINDIRTRAERIKVDADAILAQLPAPLPAGPPTVYPWLRTDKPITLEKNVPPPAQGAFTTDPNFQNVRLWRVTSEGGWGTLSASNQCQISADDKLFFALKESGGWKLIEPDILANNPFPVVREGAYSVEPTFSRKIKDVAYYAQHGTFLIKAVNMRTNVESVLFDVENDVGALSQINNQYMGACYSSEGARELLVTAYGATQELHPYVTILDVNDSSWRITLDVTRSKIRINGKPWDTLVNWNGTPANLSYGIHAVDIDRSGTWVRITVRGNAQHVFFHVPTGTIYQWGQNDGQYTWWGHHAWGNGSIIRAICGPGDPGHYQWMYSDMGVGQAPPPSRKLIAQTSVNDQNYDDHPNWNHCGVDGVLRPILCAPQRGYLQVKPWQLYDGELVLVSTAPSAPAEVYRIGHHRCPMDDGNFYSSPRAQSFHSGRVALFASHWNRQLTHRKNDLFLAEF